MSSPYDPYSNQNDSKAKHVQRQVNEVVGIMQENIDKVMERGERAEDIHNKTEELERGANQFRSGANRVRRRMWWKDMKLKLIIAAIVVVIILVIVSK
ncbi:synaptobrevin [Syncephalis fuscata]|nr:synaptobrevin [Syncephalis fuscata]